MATVEGGTAWTGSTTSTLRASQKRGRRAGRQIYKVAEVALAALGRTWPQTARDATELINELQLEPVIRALTEQPEGWAQAG
jgi:hypothetical protein